MMFLVLTPWPSFLLGLSLIDVFWGLVFCMCPPRFFELSVCVILQNGNASWNDESDGGRGRGEASRDFAKVNLRAESHGCYVLISGMLTQFHSVI